MDSTGPTQFGDLLRRFRLGAALSQEALAERAGLSVDAIRALERGRRAAPRPGTLAMLCDALTLTPSERADLITAATGYSPTAEVSSASRLPAPPNPLIGRDGDIATIVQLFRHGGVRLLTLTGPGGVGKTQLALTVAASLRDAFSDGVVFVDLAPLHDPRMVPAAAARALGVREQGARDAGSMVLTQLQGKRVLMVFDNFEHLVDAAPWLGEVVAVCPALVALVTSRRSLRIRAERQYVVPPLAMPDPGASSVDDLMERPASRLFVQRASAVDSSFRLGTGNAAAVAEICRRLDGLPLAIELAAARTQILSPEALLRRLRQRLALLTEGPRDLPHRQQTLRGTIDWSYQLLTPAERALFARLTAFTNGRPLDAVAAVCNLDGDLGPDMLTLMERLVSRSLLRKVEGLDGEPRFEMLETLSEYGRECLEHRGEIELLARRHAAYFVAFAEEASSQLSGPYQTTWLARLEEEHENLRAALAWAIDHHETETALRLAGTLWPFWEAHGHLSEGRRWLTAVLALDGNALPRLRGRALRGAGLLAAWQGDYGVAHELQEESLRLYRHLGDHEGIANALENLGLIASEQGDLTTAEQLHRESLTIRRETGDDWGIAGSLNNLALIARDRRDYQTAWRMFNGSLAIMRRLGHHQGTANVLSNLGIVAHRQGRFADAEDLHQESLGIRRSLGDQRGIAMSLCNHGLVAAAQGDWALARRLYRESLVIRWALRDVEITESLEGLAEVVGALNEPEQAAWLLGVAEATRQSHGRPAAPADQAERNRWTDRLRASIPVDRWEAAQAQGRITSLAQAVSDVLGQGAELNA